MDWNLLVNSYLKNELNKEKATFNCFICDVEMTKSIVNEIEIGNINKIFYVCSKKCHQNFLNNDIVRNLIKFEKMSSDEKIELISKYLSFDFDILNINNLIK